MRILLVEDEANIRKLLKMNLEMEGYEIVVAVDGREALKRKNEEHFDLILLDVMIPEIDGFEVCEQIRLTDRDIPILFLTAKDATENRISGLRIGADDYMTKPFSLEELLLRIKNLLKRRMREDEPNAFNTFEFGQNKIDFRTYEATTPKGGFTLTQKELMLLKMLIERANEVVSRKQILQYVWGYDVYPSTRTIDNFILNFRKYFEEDPKNPKFFKSIRGVGYKFILEV